MLIRIVFLLLGLLLGLAWDAAPADAQNLTSSEETIAVAGTAVGITADLCGASNTGGAWIQVLSNGIYFSANSATATPDSGDFTLNAGTTGPQFWIKPASKLRMIQQSAESNVKVTCTD